MWKKFQDFRIILIDFGSMCRSTSCADAACIAWTKHHTRYFFLFLLTPCLIHARGPQEHGPGGRSPLPQILADHLTLFQSRGQIMPILLLLAPLWFSDLPTALCPTLTSISTQSLLSIIQCATEFLTHKNSEESWRILENPPKSRGFEVIFEVTEAKISKTSRFYDFSL